MKHTLLSLLLLASALRAEEPAPPPQSARFVAVDNVCAWPNLNVLPDGTIAAIIHKQPSHGKMAGTIECWASKDGRLLMCHGNRVEGQLGVLARLSSDEGKTWGAPLRILHSMAYDCGYPSSVQRPDGKIVTAYYSKAVENHDRYHNRYHMGVAICEAPAAR